MRAKDALGAAGETWAAEYLVALGWVVLDRNWRCSDGEADIVALDGDTLVVCEVKTRRGLGFGSPLEAVDRDRVNRLHRVAHRYRAEQRLGRRPVRVDGIGILASPTAPRQTEHARGLG